MKVIINNSYSQIVGFTDQEFKKLREAMSYIPEENRSYFSGRNYNTKKYLIDKRGFFPTGLLYILKDFNAYYEDKRVKPKTTVKFNTQFPKPYPEQIEAAAAALKHERGYIVAPTGLGKSLIAGLVVAAFGLKTLIVVPTVNLREQLTESFRQWFGQRTVGRFGQAMIAIENVDALDPKIPANVDLLIIDEYHSSAAKTYQLLNKYSWNNIYYRIGQTATPYRNKEEETMLLRSIVSKEIHKILYQDAVSKGYIVPMEAYYIEVPTTTCDSNSWPQVYSQLVTMHSTRNAMIISLLNQLVGKSTLCLVKEIGHGKQLSCGANVPFATGEDGNSQVLLRYFNSKASSSLIGTTGVMGMGVDTKPAEYVIIAGLGKSKPAFQQQVGRGFRVYPDKYSCKIILFRDKSHKFTLSHFKAQCKILLDEYGITPIKLEINDSKPPAPIRVRRAANN